MSTHLPDSGTKPTLRPSVVYFVIGAAFFILLGILDPVPAGWRLCDFKGAYYPAKALLSHQDPYSPTAVLPLYQSAPENRIFDAVAMNMVSTCVYFPTTVTLFTPLALLSWKVASVLWVGLSVFSFAFAVYLALRLAGPSSPSLSGILLCVILSGSEVLIQAGNNFSLILCFCTVAVWCAVREKHAKIGILCMGLALVLKPQDVILIWACFLLSSKHRTQWALKSLGVAAVLALIAVIWMTSVSPHWLAEMRANMLELSLPRHVNNLAQAGDPAFWGSMKVGLQTVTSVFWSNATTYNAIAYLALTPIFLAWAWGYLRKFGDETALWVGLAAAIPLSILAGFHRQHDAALLTLAVPACVRLFGQEKQIGKIAAAFTTAAVLASSSIVLRLIGIGSTAVRGRMHGFAGTLLYAFIGRPITWALLAMSMFYTWVLLRRTRSFEGAQVPMGSFEATSA